MIRVTADRAAFCFASLALAGGGDRRFFVVMPCGFGKIPLKSIAAVAREGDISRVGTGGGCDRFAESVPYGRRKVGFEKIIARQAAVHGVSFFITGRGDGRVGHFGMQTDFMATGEQKNP